MFLKRVSKRAPFRNPFECYTDCVIGANRKIKFIGTVFLLIEITQELSFIR
jgi:hypothetical protein